MERPLTAPAAASIFSLENVGFRIDGSDILHPLSMEIGAKRVVGIIGHNGSGKSTLAKLLARQLVAPAGRIRLGGVAVESLSTREFARRLAYLPQQIPAAPGMTVRELVALGRYPWLGAFRAPGPADLAAIERGMALTGVAALAGRLVDSLSGGERQRVWLAMLVAQGTQCLVLDEPIAALDIRHQVEVMTLVQSLSREQGLSVIIVLHDVYMAGRYCDELIALRGGRVVARGDGAAILTPEALRTIYEVDMDVMIHAASGERVPCLR